MNKSIVAIEKDKDIDKMVNKAISHLGGWQNLIKPHATVVLKPNAGHAGPPASSINTNPELIASIIKSLRKIKPKKIIIAESSSIGCNTMECLKSSGIMEIAKEVDEVIDIKKEKDLVNVAIREARSDLRKVAIPRFLLEAEHIINIPIFKSHASLVFTCALKNLKGTVQDNVHFQMHQTDLTAALMDLWSIIKPDLTVADLIRPGGGFGPHTVVPLDFGCVVAGKDPVAVDATACRMVGLNVDRVVQFFESARVKNIGVYDQEQIEIRGKSIKEVFKRMWLPYLKGFETWPEYQIFPENSCSNCQSLVAVTMERLKALGEYEKNSNAVIVVGRKKELPRNIDPKNIILVGNCLKKHRDKGIWVSGCPPTFPTLTWAIVDREDQIEIRDDFRKRIAKEGKTWEEYVKELIKEKNSNSD
jgi:uncharacterized protein (DUF362 family)